MRRLGRWLLSGLTALSLLLCVAMLSLWVWSYFKTFYLLGEWSDGDSHQVRLEAGYGTLWLGLYHDGPSKIVIPFYADVSSLPRRFGQGLEGYGSIRAARAGFYLWVGNDRGRTSYNVHLPIWAICSVTFMLPAISVLRRVHRSSRLPGHCLKCGYDLRATPDRCPECGTVPAAIASTAQQEKNDPRMSTNLHE